MPAVDPAFARSVSRWLLAYPPRWRAARAAEVTDLLADLAPEGARRLDVRSGIGLLRGGCLTRWREHPPAAAYLAYLLLEARLPPRYRDWVRDDLEGPWYPLRRVLALALGFVLGAGAYALVTGERPGRSMVATFVVVVLLHGSLRGRWVREQDIAKHLVVRPGEVVTASGRVPALVARPRIAARSWLSAAVACALGTLVGSTIVLATADAMVAVLPCSRACIELSSAPVTTGVRSAALAAVAGGALVGLLLARGARRRLLRWPPAEQRARQVVALGADGWGRLAAAAVVLAVLAALVPDLAAALAVPLAGAAAAALPVLVAARSAVTSGRTRVSAGIDVLRALLGRPDTPDRPVTGYLPATVWLPPGTVAPHPWPPGGPAATAD